MKSALSIFILVLSFAASSCTVQTNVEIHDDASGQAEVTVTLNPVAVKYMTEIAMSFGSIDSEVAGPFDIAAIRRAFSMRPGVELESVQTVGNDTLRLKASFTDVRKFLASPPEITATDPVEFIADNKNHELVLQLTRSNFNRISSLFILPDNPITVLLPYQKEDFMSKNEYLEVLAYALEDYLGQMSVEEFVKDAGVYATVETDRPVKAVSGGDIVDGKAEFFIPLIDVLTLEKEIQRTVKW